MDTVETRLQGTARDTNARPAKAADYLNWWLSVPAQLMDAYAGDSA